MIILLEVAAFFQVLFDEDTNMIQQIKPQAFCLDAPLLEIGKNEVYLLVIYLVHQAVFGFMSNKAIIVSIKFVSSLSFSLLAVRPVGLRL